MICVLQMLLPNAIFLRQFESRMMFAKVWLQFINMFSEVAEVRGLGGAIYALPQDFYGIEKTTEAEIDNIIVVPPPPPDFWTFRRHICFSFLF